MGLYRHRQDLGSQPISPHWLYQRTNLPGVNEDLGTAGRRVTVCMVSREPRMVGEESFAWIVAMQWGIRRAERAQKDHGLKERLRIDRCPKRIGFVP
jgi:hypothetical protein